MRGIGWIVPRALIAAVLFLWMVGTASAQNDNGSEKKIAVVNGAVITEADFDRELARFERQYAAMRKEMSDEQLSEIKKNVLENLIAGELLYQKSRQAGIEVSDAEVDAHIEGLKKRFPNETEFKNALDSASLSETTVRSDFRRAKAIGRLIDEEIYKGIAIPEEEARQYYNENQKLFMQPEQVRASHILIKVDPQADPPEKEKARAKIEEIQKKLQNGGDFAALAGEHSQCPSAANGGDLGFFARGRMVAPFEEAAFGLKPGESSDIVETEFGYHIIKVVDRKAESPIEYEKIKDKLEQLLSQSKLQEEVGRLIANLEKDAKIERSLPE